MADTETVVGEARTAAELLKQMYESNGQDARGVWDFIYRKPAPPVAVPAPTDVRATEVCPVEDCPGRLDSSRTCAHCGWKPGESTAYGYEPPAPTEPSGATELPEPTNCFHVIDDSEGNKIGKSDGELMVLAADYDVVLHAYFDYKAKYEAALREIAEHATRCHDLRLELKGKP